MNQTNLPRYTLPRLLLLKMQEILKLTEILTRKHNNINDKGDSIRKDHSICRLKTLKCLKQLLLVSVS